MIEGLDSLLEDCGDPGVAEVRHLLAALLGGPGTAGRVVGQYRLKHAVYRLQFEIEGRPHFLVAKCMHPYYAQRNWLVAQRWLPAVGLADSGPPLLGVAAARDGQAVWHLYEDLGDCRFDTTNPHPKYIEAAVAVIGQLHTRFAGHPLLAECRLWAGDRGIAFYTANVKDAVRCLEALRPPALVLSDAQVALRDHWLTHLAKLLDEQPLRIQMLADCGGPETLLHGDLWPTNILIRPADKGLCVRLIDWDRTGVGLISYDLSTFLYRFPLTHRPWILDCYRQAVAPLGWNLPAPEQLNLLFDTAERARLTSRVLWAALGVREGHVEWGFAELAAFSQWFEQLEPVLPIEGDRRE